jgi:ABC-type proline/glycine betaine transport system substrate-binding protein
MFFPPEELDRMAQDVDAGRSTIDQVVDDWMNGNQSSWKRWITASKNWMTP